MVSELSRALSTRERINSNQLWQFKWCEVIHRNDNDIDITRLQFIDILRSILLFNRDTVLIAFTLCKSVLSSLFLSSSTRGGLVRWAKNQKPYVWLLSFRVRPFGCYSLRMSVSAATRITHWHMRKKFTFIDWRWYYLLWKELWQSTVLCVSGKNSKLFYALQYF